MYRYFRNFKRVKGSEHGRGANEFNDIQEYEGENCYIPSGNGCFLKCINYIFEKDFSTEYFEFIQSYKRRTNVMTRCGIPKVCKRYKLDIGIYDLNSKRILTRNVKQKKTNVYIFIKFIIVLFGRKTEKILYLML